MKSHIIVAIGGLVAAVAFAFSGCSSSPQQIQPASRGQRGETCQARNECASGLACISGVCAKNEFNIAPQAKMCAEIDCTTTKDCCGTLPTTLPTACKNFQSVCRVPTIPNCTSALACTTSADCGGGSCNGTCTNYSKTCAADADCIEHCVAGSCSFTSLSCTVDTDCTYNTTFPGTCSTTRYCNCTNPAYNPSDPLCLNTDCENVCNLVCNKDQQCVTNNTCASDADCISDATRPICSQGSCVQCVAKSDCADQTQDCLDNVCKKPCTVNEECPIFSKCDTTSGKCVEQGCTSDTECILYFSGQCSGASCQSAVDARLWKCLPSDTDPTMKTCKVPCENDAGCQQFESCVAGYCKFIGCQTDEECRAYFNAQSETTTPTHPYVTKAVCRAPTPTTP